MAALPLLLNLSRRETAKDKLWVSKELVIE